MRRALGRLYTGMVRCLLSLRPGVAVGAGTRISLGATIRASRSCAFTIGSGCKVLRHAYIDTNGGSISIGDGCHINPFAVLYSGKRGRLVIGSHVLIAAHSSIVASNHVFDSVAHPIVEQSIRSKGITIEDDVWIASGARILDGVRIGKGSVVGAGAVVTRSVPPYSVVAGVPARVIRRRGEAGRG